jgi:MATE family multidrug resistance protein
MPLLFSKNEEVIGISASLLVIAAFFQLSDGTQVVGLGALRGIKDVRIPTIITLIAYWVIGLPMSYVLAFKMDLGVQGVWYGLSIGLTIAAVLLFWRFNIVSKKIR